MDLIVLSPHLDDAVFSVGGLIVKTATTGGKVEVVTFFTGTADPGTGSRRFRAFSDYEVRKREDARALQALGASPHWLDYQERIFREPRLRGFLSVFRTPETIEGFPNLASMRATVSGILDAYPGSRVLSPLGVGNHVDHLEVFLASATAMLDRRAFGRFRFYEDAYALGGRARRAHPVTRGATWPRRKAPDRASLRVYLMLGVIALARRGPSPLSYLPREGQRLRWESEPSPLDGHEQAKLEAVAAYASQVGVMGGIEGVAEAMRRNHRLWGGAEPLWRASPLTGE